MKKNRNIPIINPQLFVKDYFDHALMKEDGYNINTILPKDQTNFFIITSIEAQKKYINFPKESIKTTSYQFVFLTKGDCIVTDNLMELKLTSNQIWIIGPGKINSTKELSKDIEGFVCLFDQAFMDAYSGLSNVMSSFAFFDLDAFPVISLTEQQSVFFSFILQKVKQDFTENYKNTKSIICHYILSVFKECSLYYEKITLDNKNLTSSDRIAQEFLQLVNKHYLSKRALSDYADMLNVTPKHLSKCVKQSTGVTPMDFIYKMLILEAKVLLKETTLTVSEIAYQLSFEDAAHFGRFFKQHASSTPAGFRKNKSR
jgi:AraC-like DNA-binding protein